MGIIRPATKEEESFMKMDIENFIIKTRSYVLSKSLKIYNKMQKQNISDKDKMIFNNCIEILRMINKFDYDNINKKLDTKNFEENMLYFLAVKDTLIPYIKDFFNIKEKENKDV